MDTLFNHSNTPFNFLVVMPTVPSVYIIYTGGKIRSRVATEYFSVTWGKRLDLPWNWLHKTDSAVAFLHVKEKTNEGQTLSCANVPCCCLLLHSHVDNSVNGMCYHYQSLLTCHLSDTFIVTNIYTWQCLNSSLTNVWLKKDNTKIYYIISYSEVLRVIVIQ